MTARRSGGSASREDVSWIRDSLDRVSIFNLCDNFVKYSAEKLLGNLIKIQFTSSFFAEILLSIRM